MTPAPAMRRIACVCALWLLAVTALAGSLAVVPSQASAYSDIEVQFDYPTFAGKSQTVPCTLIVSGGPAEDEGGNFTYKAEVVADNTTGSSVSPSTFTTATGIFKFNVTMPGEAPQDIKIKINVSSKAGISRESTYRVVEFGMKVVDPIEIRATVYNTGEVDVKGAIARFYADGTLLGTKTFDVSAGASKELVYNWTWVEVPEGKHVVTVEIDDPNSIVEFSDGNNVYSMTIYVGEQGNPLGAVLMVLVVIVGVLFVLTFMQKPARRKKF